MLSDSVAIALVAVAMAIVNTVGSVLILWIRAKYRWKNGGPAPKH